MHYDNTLYIIGNGFDLYHGANSSFSHFKEYVKRKNYGLFMELESFFMPHDLWSNFEANLASALMDLGLMTRVEILYKQAEEFRQVQLKRHTDKVTSRLINKAEIRKEATERLRYLFKVIELYHSLTGDEVWMEMAEKVRELVTEATSE